MRDGSRVLEQLTGGQGGKVVDPEINPDYGLWVGGERIVTLRHAGEGHEPPAGLGFDGGESTLAVPATTGPTTPWCAPWSG